MISGRGRRRAWEGVGGRATGVGAVHRWPCHPRSRPMHVLVANRGAFDRGERSGTRRVREAAAAHYGRRGRSASAGAARGAAACGRCVWVGQSTDRLFGPLRFQRPKSEHFQKIPKSWSLSHRLRATIGEHRWRSAWRRSRSRGMFSLAISNLSGPYQHSPRPCHTRPKRIKAYSIPTSRPTSMATSCHSQLFQCFRRSPRLTNRILFKSKAM